MAKKVKNTEFRTKLLCGLGIILILALILLSVMEYANRKAQKTVNTLYDTTVIDYEAYTSNLDSLVTIYSIWNDNSYQQAQSKVKIADSLRKEIFPTEHYTGTSYVKKPTVTVTECLYELEDSLDNVRTYLVTLEIKNNDNDKYRVYSVVATLKGELLVDYYTL